MQLGVTVPVYNRWDMTKQFLDQCLRDREDIAGLMVYDNGSDRDQLRALYAWADVHAPEDDLWLTIERRPDWNIHQMWNDGINWCENAYGAEVVAVLNNDIAWRPGALRQSAKHLIQAEADLLLWDNPLRSFPTSGSVKTIIPTVKEPGPAGWAMFLRAGKGYRFDERFHFYGGDLDMNMQVAAAGGKVVRWFRPPAKHWEHASHDDSPRYRRLIHLARTEDHDLWVKKWGDHPQYWLKGQG